MVNAECIFLRVKPECKLQGFESNEEKQEIIYSTYVSKRLGRLILWAFNGMIMMVVSGKELDAHQSGETDHDGDQLSHAGDLNLVLFSLKDLEDDDVDQSSSGQALQDGHCQGVGVSSSGSARNAHPDANADGRDKREGSHVNAEQLGRGPHGHQF